MNGFLLTIQVEGEKYTDEMEAIFIHVSQLPSVSTKFHAMTQTRFQNVHPCHLSRICLYYATVGPRARTETLARARPELNTIHRSLHREMNQLSNHDSKRAV